MDEIKRENVRLHLSMEIVEDNGYIKLKMCHWGKEYSLISSSIYVYLFQVLYLSEMFFLTF